MGKLKLQLDGLRVESFSTEPADAGRGTVQAHEWFGTTTCVETKAINTCWCTERTCP
jgi:hypothetical protein